MPSTTMKRRTSSRHRRKSDRTMRPGTSDHKSKLDNSNRSKSPRKSQPKGRASHNLKNRERIDPRFRFTGKRRAKPTLRRYSNRSFHQMNEFKGKVVELVQIFTSGDYNSISIRFQDKTSLDFAIDTGLTVDTDYTDWKTGNMRRIRRWPLIRSEPR
jgi:hypothetical protein